MGVSTIALTRIHKSQKNKVTIDKSHLAWDMFPYSGHVKTYIADHTVGGSAATATAFNCGIKTRHGMLGIDDNILCGSDCRLVKEKNKCKSAFHYAVEAGKLTGIVTTTRLTHATPAAAYAHTTNRYWEDISRIPDHLKAHCQDIASQLVENPENQDIRVLLGGGRRNFFTNMEPDVEHPNLNGSRTDSVNMVELWKNIKRNKGLVEPTFRYVHQKQDFENVDPAKTKYLLGMFDHDHMQYESDRANDTNGEPSLAEMVQKAIEILQRSDNGFYLYVEGGRIDHAHHTTQAQRAAIETIAFSDAVQKAKDMTNEEDTLIVVSSDHSHVVTINGYEHLDSPLYGPAVNINGEYVLGLDGLPYMTVSYANGPGWSDHQGPGNKRRNLSGITEEEYNSIGFMQPTLVNRRSETHGGDDVPVFASGPWSHLFTGTVEQHFLPDAIEYAACFHPEIRGEHCTDDITTGPTETGGAVSTGRYYCQPVLIILYLAFFVFH